MEKVRAPPAFRGVGLQYDKCLALKGRMSELVDCLSSNGKNKSSSGSGKDNSLTTQIKKQQYPQKKK
jgi:hypothetical protein